MRKTSVYLNETDVARLRRLADRLDVSQAQVIRDALERYDRSVEADRDFAVARSGRGPGTTIADVSEEELLEGFGA